MKTQFFKSLVLYSIPVIFAITFTSCNKCEPCPVSTGCGAEMLTPDGKSFLSENILGGTFQNTKTQTDEKSFTGKYCARLDTNCEFGFTYSTFNLQTGSNLKVSIRRHNSNKNGKLVIQSITSGLLYQSVEVGSPEKEENGWELLELDVTIPSEMQNEGIKIYAWNPSPQQPVFFDDIKISYFVPVQK